MQILLYMFGIVYKTKNHGTIKSCVTTEGQWNYKSLESRPLLILAQPSCIRDLFHWPNYIAG